MSALSLTSAALGAAVLACAVAGASGQVATARAEADTAADLAALAVASRVVRGEPGTAACAVGSVVAAGPSTTLTGCSVAGEVVTVSVRRDLSLLQAVIPVAAVARAGPAGG